MCIHIEGEKVSKFSNQKHRSGLNFTGVYINIYFTYLWFRINVNWGHQDQSSANTDFPYGNMLEIMNLNRENALIALISN